jgi:hypothetical protein
LLETSQELVELANESEREYGKHAGSQDTLAWCIEKLPMRRKIW